LFFEKEDVQKKEREPDAGNFAGTERQQTADCSKPIAAHTRVACPDLASKKDQQPPAASKDKSQTVGAAGDIIDGSAMHRMNDPEKRNEKGSERGNSTFVQRGNALYEKQFRQQKIEKNAAEDV
jgi:hypothetical protein